MENEEKINDVLRSLGLTKTEVSIYMDLLRHKSSTAQDISKRVNIYRSNAYESLRRLKKRGFVSEVNDNDKTLFLAGNPNIMTEFVKQKAVEVEEVIPLMKEMMETPNKKEEVSIFHGIVNLRSKLLGILELKKPIFIYDIPDDITIKMGEVFVDNFHKERIRKKIFLKGIYVKDVERMGIVNKMPYTEARFLSGKDTSVYTLICDNCVFFIVFGDPLTVIEINSKDIAESHKHKFEILWESAKG